MEVFKADALSLCSSGNKLEYTPSILTSSSPLYYVVRVTSPFHQ